MKKSQGLHLSRGKGIMLSGKAPRYSADPNSNEESNYMFKASAGERLVTNIIVTDCDEMRIWNPHILVQLHLLLRELVVATAVFVSFSEVTFYSAFAFHFVFVLFS